MNNHFGKSSSTSSNRSSRASSSKDEKESGYESYQDSICSRDQVTIFALFHNYIKYCSCENIVFHMQGFFHNSSSASSSRDHKMNSHASSMNIRHRQICLTCGRLAKQVGSTSFYDIHNTTTFATSDGYVSIAKKLRDLFHLELPRSKIIASDQICRKCFRALNEIHFLETQVIIYSSTLDECTALLQVEWHYIIDF